MKRKLIFWLAVCLTAALSACGRAQEAPALPPLPAEPAQLLPLPARQEEPARPGAFLYPFCGIDFQVPSYMGIVEDQSDGDEVWFCCMHGSEEVASLVFSRQPALSEENYRAYTALLQADDQNIQDYAGITVAGIPGAVMTLRREGVAAARSAILNDPAGGQFISVMCIVLSLPDCPAHDYLSDFAEMLAGAAPS